MANKATFKNAQPKAADCVNRAGGLAYCYSAEEALAQYAAVGTFSESFYEGAASQLDRVRKLAEKCDPEFVAQTAVFARKAGYRKDVPAFLLAVLSRRDPELFNKIFDKVVDNGKQLRNFVQIIRSGASGRKSVGSGPKARIRRWLDVQSGNWLFRNSVGQSPSMADILRIAHPKPATAEKSALYRYFLNRAGLSKDLSPEESEKLPSLVREFEAYKQSDGKGVPPRVPFQMLTQLPLTTEQWSMVALAGGWHFTRMNLNTFARHGVLNDEAMVERIAEKLTDREQIDKARVYPYQLLAAYRHVSQDMPRPIIDALHDALEIATENVEALPGKVYVFPDVSGSMRSSVTGYRTGNSSKVRCVDVAGLVASVILRANPDAEIIPFEGRVHPIRLEPRDTVMTNADKLASIGGGSTACSAPLRLLNERGAKGDVLIYVSDNESWVDVPAEGGMRLYAHHFKESCTETLREWTRFKRRNPKAKLVCINTSVYDDAQVPPREDVMYIGGFSDYVFDIIRFFVNGELNGQHWVDMIKQVEL